MYACIRAFASIYVRICPSCDVSLCTPPGLRITIRVLICRAAAPKYTQEVGGNGGTVCEDKCADGAYINHWKVRAGSVVDSIMGLCTDGKWLKNCGGNGGGLWEGDADARSLPVRCGTGPLNKASAMLSLRSSCCGSSPAGEV